MTDSLPIPIIRSKLYQPARTPDLISRDRLLISNQVGIGGKVTLVSAPAGYGKSTVASEFIDAAGVSCAWVSLDPADSDLKRFLTYVIAALQDAVPGCCLSTAQNLQPSILPPGEVLAGTFCNDLDELEESVVLVLDDFYYIAATEIHDFLNQIFRHPPRTLHIVIITRRDPPLSLQTLRASAELTEIRMEQLAFTETETAEFVRHHLGDAISGQAITKLHERTEGWPAALRMAMLAISSSDSADAFVDSVPSDIHAVHEYLLQEVIGKCGPETRDFLLRTAFLDRFCESLSEALLADDVQGSENSSGEKFMTRIRDSGLFSIALDDRKKWFRYHHLFQTMLQEQAYSDLGEDEIHNIHIRASRWFEEQDFLEEAISHLIRADSLSEAAALIIRHRNAIMNHEQWHRLDNWLRMLPSHLIEEKPELLLLKARFLRTRGDIEESSQVLDQAKALIETTSIGQELREELFGSLESARCYLLYSMSDGIGAAAAARRSLELLPDESLAERGFALIILAAALQMTGDIESARSIPYSAMSGGSGFVQTSATFDSRVLIALGFVQWMDADLNGLEATADQGSALAASANLREALTVLRCFQASILYDRNELSNVHDRLQDIVHSKVIGNAQFHAECLIISSLTHQELGDSLAATYVAESLRAYALATQNVYLIAHTEAFSAELALRQGRSAEALSWADRFDAEPLTPLYSFFSPPLTLAKVLVLDDGDKSRERADTLLTKLINYLTLTHNNRFLIEALALRAMLFDAKGEQVAATKDLMMAIELAQPSRFIRLFVDLGPRLGSLLNRLELSDERLNYVGEILAGFRMGHDEPATTAMLVPATNSEIGVEPLSKRELQILTQLAERLSNKEIAEKLHISTVTVKRHAANIYQKLGVHGRRQAVAKAVGLGMFSHPD